MTTQQQPVVNLFTHLFLQEKKKGLAVACMVFSIVPGSCFLMKAI